MKILPEKLLHHHFLLEKKLLKLWLMF